MDKFISFWKHLFLLFLITKEYVFNLKNDNELQREINTIPLNCLLVAAFGIFVNATAF